MLRHLSYAHDPAGNMQTLTQNNSVITTYAYDGANQLVGETSGGTYPPPAFGFTYDHNGNRLTQSVNGSPYQSFTYDAHDKMQSGTAGGETPGYDKNGSQTSLSIYGSVYRFVYDDEDRLTSLTTPGGVTDTFTYNGLGLRVGKTDSAGSYSYMCDGASPGSPVLSDGHALYTPGLSENRGGVAAYYSNDRLGNLWLLDGTTKNQLTYADFNGFGVAVSGGLGGTSFGFGGGNGCQSDADTGLVLMGHRYYDPRIGRFISQDPAGDGDNWYAYCGNNPVNGVDPLGLTWEDPSPNDHQPGTGDWDNGDPTGMVGDQYTNEKGERVTHWQSNSDGGFGPGGGMEPGVNYVSGGSLPMFHQHDNDPPNIADDILITLLTVVLTEGHEETPFYRGGTDFTASKGEVKMTGNKVQPMKRGISLFSNKSKIPSRFVPNRVTRIPGELTIQQRGLDPEHYEVLTKEEMEFERYNELLKQIQSEPE